MKEIDLDKVYEALYKLCIGAQSTETVEEYVGEDNALKTRKTTTKHLPPDLNAIKLLLALPSDDYSKMSEEELEAEKQKLLNLLTKE